MIETDIQFSLDWSFNLSLAGNNLKEIKKVWEVC